jgi:hypothetical protein
MKNILTYLLIYIFSFNSTFAIDGEGISLIPGTTQNNISLFERNELPQSKIPDPISIPDETIPIKEVREIEANNTIASVDVNDDEFTINTMSELLTSTSNLCKDENGHWLAQTVTDPINPNEKLNCQDLAKLDFELASMAYKDEDEKNIFRCKTQGMATIDQLYMARDLGLDLEKHFNCPGKTQKPNECLEELLCDALSSSGLEGIFNSVTSYIDIGIKSCPSSEAPSCLSEVLNGFISDIMLNVDGFWGLMKLASKGAGKLLSNINPWAETQEIEDAQATKLHALSTADQETFFNRFIEHPIETTRSMISNLLSSMKVIVGEAIGDNFGCAKWSANRFNPLDDKEATCLEPVVNWDCGTCVQKRNMICGVMGFMGGEVLATILTGGALTSVNIAGKTAISGVLTAKSTVAVSNLIPGSEFAGHEFEAPETNSQNTFFQENGAIIGVASLSSRNLIGIVKKGNLLAIRMGNRYAPLDEETAKLLLNSLSQNEPASKDNYNQAFDKALLVGFSGEQGLRVLNHMNSPSEPIILNSSISSAIINDPFVILQTQRLSKNQIEITELANKIRTQQVLLRNNTNTESLDKLNTLVDEYDNLLKLNQKLIVQRGLAIGAVESRINRSTTLLGLDTFADPLLEKSNGIEETPAPGPLAITPSRPYLTLDSVVNDIESRRMPPAGTYVPMDTVVNAFNAQRPVPPTPVVEATPANEIVPESEVVIEEEIEEAPSENLGYRLRVSRVGETSRSSKTLTYKAEIRKDSGLSQEKEAEIDTIIENAKFLWKCKTEDITECKDIEDEEEVEFKRNSEDSYKIEVSIQVDGEQVGKTVPKTIAKRYCGRNQECEDEDDLDEFEDSINIFDGLPPKFMPPAPTAIQLPPRKTFVTPFVY